MEGTHTVTIARPASEVFEFIMDVERISEWQLGGESVTVSGAEEGRFVVGATVTETRKIVGQSLNINRRVTGIDEGREIRFSSEPDAIYRFTVAYRVKALDATTTQMTADYDADMGGFFATAEPLLRVQAEKVFTANLEQLKLVLETGSDGG